jgi:hypothetical protein
MGESVDKINDEAYPETYYYDGIREKEGTVVTRKIILPQKQSLIW